MNLADLLDRATDGLEPAGRARVALTDARRRRARRLVAAGTAATVVAVVGTVSLLHGGLGDSAPGPSISPTPGVPMLPSEDPSAGDVGIDPDDQPLWDPVKIEDGPSRESVLPERLEPPVDPPSLIDRPMHAAMIAWPEDGEDVRLLGTDGEWRRIPGTDDAAPSTWWYSNPALSSDGTQVALSSRDGILLADVTTGEQEVIAWPEELSAPWDSAPEVRWLPGDAGLAVFHWNGNWVVDLDGEWRGAPFGFGHSSAVAIDPDGRILQQRWQQDVLVEWQGDDATGRVPFPHQGERFVTRHGLVAFTTGSLGEHPRGGPVVADAATGELLAYAPIRDPHAYYSDNAGLTAQGFLDEDTVLLLVGAYDSGTMEAGAETWHLVAWDFRTGDFERLTSGDAEMRTIDVATDLVSGD